MCKYANLSAGTIYRCDLWKILFSYSLSKVSGTRGYFIIVAVYILSGMCH